MPQMHLLESMAPVPVGRLDNYQAEFEGRGFRLPRIGKMMVNNETGRFADICGANTPYFIPHVGWVNSGLPVCFTATCQGEVIAAAWCSPIRMRDNRMGCNVTYAVHSAHEGKGLIKPLIGLAFVNLLRQANSITFVNIQTRADNARSVALAMSLGFEHAPIGDFEASIPGLSEPLQYVGFTTSVTAFRAKAESFLDRIEPLDITGQMADKTYDSGNIQMDLYETNAA